MSGKKIERRDFLKSLFVGMPALALDWSSFPRGKPRELEDENAFDAVIIGAGLGGLSCAAAFARQGFKPLVLEQHYQAGGYATTFKRRGGFVFDVSLHSTTIGKRNGMHNLIPGFPEIKDVEFIPYKHLYRVIYPDYDLNVPAKNLKGYIAKLSEIFPDEKQGIEGLFEDMRGLTDDINKYSSAEGSVDMTRFPSEFPYLFKCFNKTWGDLVNIWINNPKLRVIISSLWGYYGLPPSKLACIYYVLPTMGYLQEGGCYPLGKSEKISSSMVKFIEERGVKLCFKPEWKKF